MKIVMLGPPGVGKGTIASLLKEKKNLNHISTGDLLRNAIKKGTKKGLDAKEYMDRGDLVPNELIVSIFKEGVSHLPNYILDGFPRNIDQAKALEENKVEINKVINLFAEDEILIERITNRRVCTSCNAVYNLLYSKPKKEGICDKCGGKLIQRTDDSLEAVKHRLKVYHNLTEPLIEYYTKKGIIINVDANINNPALVFERTLAVFENS